MGRIEKSIEIKASPEKVWELLAFDRFWRIQKNVKSVDYTSEAHNLKDKLKVGASARSIDRLAVSGARANCYTYCGNFIR